MGVEQRARELLAAACPSVKDEYFDNSPHMTAINLHEALIAVRSALTPPEGYVLVPVVPTEDMTWAPSDVEVGYPSWAGSRDCCTTDEAKAVWAAMVAARPEVTL